MATLEHKGYCDLARRGLPERRFHPGIDALPFLARGMSNGSVQVRLDADDEAAGIGSLRLDPALRTKLLIKSERFREFLP